MGQFFGIKKNINDVPKSSKADIIFQNELLKRISLAKVEKRKKDPLDFTSGTLRGF